MDENYLCDKENVIGHIDCSPVLPVAKESRVPTSPLSPLQESRQDNVFNSPRLEKSIGFSSIVEKPVPEKVLLLHQYYTIIQYIYYYLIFRS